MKPVVAIVGRPNVGKSTLFNRITRSKDALVDDFPGVTRDRHYGQAVWNDIAFTLVDTGGFAGGDDFASLIRVQVRQAIDDADVIVLLFDGKHGVSPFDKELVDLLRPIAKPVLFVVNKIDGIEHEMRLDEFYSLGVEKLYPLSAEHRYGFNDLMDELLLTFQKDSLDSAIEDDTDIRLAVVGRPNVGKSSFINRILGQERLLVSDIPGTTRDAVDTSLIVDGRSYRFVDTAGIRRKGKVTQKLEKFSIIKSLKSLDRCDIALMLMDAREGITDQDVTIAGYAYERGCGCLVLMNKWDLVEKTPTIYRQYEEQFKTAAKFLSFAPMMTISALTGQRVGKVFGQINQIYAQYCTRIGTGQLNKLFKTALDRHPPPLYRGRRIKLYYATQTAVKPPTIICFVNYPMAVHFSYKRYLINQIRRDTGLNKTPVRLVFREREGRKGKKQ